MHAGKLTRFHLTLTCITVILDVNRCRQLYMIQMATCIGSCRIIEMYGDRPTNPTHNYGVQFCMHVRRQRAGEKHRTRIVAVWVPTAFLQTANFAESRIVSRPVRSAKLGAGLMSIWLLITMCFTPSRTACCNSSAVFTETSVPDLTGSTSAATCDVVSDDTLGRSNSSASIEAVSRCRGGNHIIALCDSTIGRGYRCPWTARGSLSRMSASFVPMISHVLYVRATTLYPR